ncbi:hypothetical protein [Vibrio harveyi]|uniref:hypothetical protein n=1 Tax=Vibrio harveyi TaxID=669 RepID=UPI0025B1F5F3|nr:hypothetical protein [Vibrio harveyi]WJT10991.1 hypothetical protein PH545_28760 [Vibrio harveyi]
MQGFEQAAKAALEMLDVKIQQLQEKADQEGLSEAESFYFEDLRQERNQLANELDSEA